MKTREMIKEDKLEQEKREFKVQCKHCDHKIGFYPFEHKDVKICRYCNHAVYRNDFIEFKMKLESEIKKCKK